MSNREWVHYNIRAVNKHDTNQAYIYTSMFVVNLAISHLHALDTPTYVLWLWNTEDESQDVKAIWRKRVQIM